MAEKFEQSDISSSGSSEDDALPPLLRVQKYAQSTNAFDRQVVSRVTIDLFRNAPEAALTEDLPKIMDLITRIADEDETMVRVDLLDQIPQMASQAELCSNRVHALEGVATDYLVPLVVKNLGSCDNSVDKAAHSALLHLLDSGLISNLQLEIHVCPNILALLQVDTPNDIKKGIIILMCKMVAFMDADVVERVFLGRFAQLCASTDFGVKKICASYFGNFCAAVGQKSYVNILLPCFIKLCEDDIWGVRKSCAEVFMFVSCASTEETRRSVLAPIFAKLLDDSNKWVIMAAFQSLGPFISTFANPRITKMAYNEMGELTLVNNEGNEYLMHINHNPMTDTRLIFGEGKLFPKFGGKSQLYIDPFSDYVNNLSNGGNCTPIFTDYGFNDKDEEEERDSENIVDNIWINEQSEKENVANESNENSEENDTLLKELYNEVLKRKSPKENTDNTNVNEDISKDIENQNDSLEKNTTNNTDNSEENSKNDNENQINENNVTDSTSDSPKTKIKFDSETPSLGTRRRNNRSDSNNLDKMKDLHLNLVKEKHETQKLINESGDSNMNIPDCNSNIKCSTTNCGDGSDILMITEKLENLKIEKIDIQNCSSVSETQQAVADNKEELENQVNSTHLPEDDTSLHLFNSYNYWYISPEMPLDPTIIDDGRTSSALEEGRTPNDSLSRQKVDKNLYYKYFENDLADDNNDNSTSTQSPAEEETKPKLPSQDIVPQVLIDHFISMTNPWLQSIDNEMAYHCAYSLPAVALTLGSTNWNLLKDLVQTLAGHIQYKVRRTVASCLHELAMILGPEVATTHLTPIFEGFLQDLDEVKIGILKHLAEFLELIEPAKRVTYLPRLQNFLYTDNQCNWRFRKELATQLLQALSDRLFKPTDAASYVSHMAQELLCDKVAAVRQEAVTLICEVIEYISDEPGLTPVLLVKLAEKFAHSKQWKRRQTFVLLCSELLATNVLSNEQFATDMMPYLLDLTWDTVANVRLAVARTLVEHIATNEYFLDPTNNSQCDLDSLLRRLQADKDRDVRLSATIF